MFEPTEHSDDLSGLARRCPKCKIIAHYDVKGRKPTIVDCPCGYSFTVQKYKKGERPKAEKPDGQKLVEFCDRMMGK